MKRLLILGLALSLSACGARVADPPKSITPPPEKLVCGSEPAVPSEPITDEKNADYLTSLRSWGLGCWTDVEWLRSFYKEINRR